MIDAALLKAISTNAHRADTVAIGTVESIGPAPRIWSGLVAAYQEVQYGAVVYLKHRPQDAELPSVKVSHPVVARSRTADEHVPMLRSDLFAKGSRLILFLRTTASRLETFDEDHGVISAAPEVLEAVEAALRPRP